MTAPRLPEAVPPELQRLGPAVLITGGMLPYLVVAAAAARRHAISEGRRADVIKFERMQATAYAAFEGWSTDADRADARVHTDMPEAIPREWITPQEAAQRVGRSRRQISRLARKLACDGTARRVGSNWLLDPAAVDDHYATRLLADN